MEDLLATLAVQPTSSGTLEWMVFLAIKYANSFLQATWLTLYVAVIGTIVGFVLGFLVGIVGDVKVSDDDAPAKRLLVKVMKFICNAYVEVFRDTPMIVQAMVIFYGLRQSGIEISMISAGILVTLLNTGSYMAETVRAGINSVDPGQREGALAMGFSPLKAMIVVILPQAFKNIFPEMANTFLSNLKMTSVLNVIGLSELFMAAKTVGGNYYKYFEAYLDIAVVYFVLCFTLTRAFRLIEKRMELKSDYVLAAEYIEK